MNRQFGIELEIVGISRETAIAALSAVNINVVSEDYNHTTRSHWKIVSDASVSDGFEVVSPILCGEAGLAQAEIAARALDDAGARVDYTCGLHVHFDASDLSLDHLKAIVRRYAAHEEEIDAFMPRSRRGCQNRYCKSMEFFAARDFERITSISDFIDAQDDRYYKVNLQSLRRHGTIEFRQHSGTVNAAKITSWVRFLAAFIKECKNSAAATATSLPVLSGVQGKLAKMFAAQGTVSLAAMCETFGWLEKSARAAVTRLRRAGMEIRPVKVDGKPAYMFNGNGAADSLWRGIEPAIALFYQRRAAVLAVAQ